MVELAELLIEKADGYRALAAHHREQATVGSDVEQVTHLSAAERFELLELTLRELADAFAEAEAA